MDRCKLCVCMYVSCVCAGGSCVCTGVCNVYMAVCVMVDMCTHGQ